MLLILFIVIGFLSSTQVLAQDHSCGSHAMTTTTKADGSKLGLFISPAQISSSPAWKPGTGEPPLPFSRAVQLALHWAKAEYKRFDDVQIRSVHVTSYGCPSPENRWYYNVDFTPIMDGNPMFATGYFVAILMDGTIIAPTPIK